MKSRFAEEFCHDEIAPGYDGDVKNEAHPIRAGYSAVLSWVASTVRPGTHVLDLGAGTGNLGSLLPPPEELVCVDVSARMLEIARGKLEGLPAVRFVVEDLLSYCSTCTETFDHIVSTYAIHHLTDPEKSELLRHVRRLLRGDGSAAFGDLMFADGAERERIAARHRELGTGIEADIAEEFFWDIERTSRELAAERWRLESRRFSELSWGILVRRAGRETEG